jgi:hypothetical protein
MNGGSTADVNLPSKEKECPIQRLRKVVSALKGSIITLEKTIKAHEASKRVLQLRIEGLDRSIALLLQHNKSEAVPPKIKHQT